MKTARLFFLLFIFLMPAAEGLAGQVVVQNVRLWPAPDHTRVVFDVNTLPEYRLLQLQNPSRVAVDMVGARLAGRVTGLDASGPRVSGIRTGKLDGNTLRVVLDLKSEANPNIFVLKPIGQYGHRLVVDLFDVQAEAADREPERPVPPPTERPEKREWVIAIDAGHGGEDPGAIGRRYRTYEKTVVLAIARELKKLVAAAPGMRPVMIRDGDYYTSLGDRRKEAHRQRADIFISIHADALPGRQASGSSVYTLSEHGATSAAAKYLAGKENASDLIGGVNLHDAEEMLAKVLLDLTQRKTISYSYDLGKDVLSGLKRVGPVHMDTVAQAGFAVLKAPTIPSILIETAFISNPREERKLRSRGYQRQLARGIFNGIKAYIARGKERTPQPLYAKLEGPHEHVVRRGETLSHIARRYDIHIDALKFANNLTGNDLPVGLRLRIP